MAGDASENFDWWEFACRCGRKHYRRAAVDLAVVELVQRIRTAAGRPMPIVSGYRCEAHNRAIGGAPNGQHPRRRAADIPQGFASVEAAVRFGARGVGYRNGWAVHVDVRGGSVVTFAD